MLLSGKLPAGEQQPGLEVGEGYYNTGDLRPQTGINFLRCPGKCISRDELYISQTPVTICSKCSETQQQAYSVWMGLIPRRKLPDPFLGFLKPQALAGSINTLQAL